MDSKQRAKLKSLAQNLDTIIQIGKNGVTEETIKVVMDAFNTRELIKIRTIESCPLENKDVAVILSEKTNSEVVQVIGSRIVLYKKKPVVKSKKKIINKIKLNFDQDKKIRSIKNKKINKRLIKK